MICFIAYYILHSVRWFICGKVFQLEISKSAFSLRNFVREFIYWLYLFIDFYFVRTNNQTNSYRNKYYKLQFLGLKLFIDPVMNYQSELFSCWKVGCCVAFYPVILGFKINKSIVTLNSCHGIVAAQLLEWFNSINTVL